MYFFFLNVILSFRKLSIAIIHYIMITVSQTSSSGGGAMTNISSQDYSSVTIAMVSGQAVVIQSPGIFAFLSFLLSGRFLPYTQTCENTLVLNLHK